VDAGITATKSRLVLLRVVQPDSGAHPNSSAVDTGLLARGKAAGA
jgi:hypothetical protein